MGTGALALALGLQATTWEAPWLAWLSRAFLVVASALAVVLLPRYLSRLGDRAHLAAEVADPAHGAMLATLPAGLLVLATGWGRVGPGLVGQTAALWVDAVLLVAGTIIALGLGFAWSAAIMRATPGLEGVNGGWLIPPVMNLIVPLALTPLIAVAGGAAPLLLMAGFAFYGIGTVLFLVMLTLLVARLAMREPMPPAMAPSLWIPLAPAGVVGLSLVQLLRAAQEAEVPGYSSATAGVLVAVMGLGFGLWWAGFAAVELQRIRRAGGPPRHPGWWGFVFPIGAMTLSLATVGLVTGITVLEVAGAVTTGALAVVWGLVAARTAGMLTAPRTPA
jgi:tellurite resistance protein TehA-like permease